MGDIVRGSSAALAFRLAGAAATFAFTVVLARTLHAHGAGLYFLAFTAMSVATIAGRLGLDNALLRFAAEADAAGDPDGLASVHRVGMRIALLAGAAASALLFAGAPWLATLAFHQPGLTAPLRWIALAVLPYTLFTLYGELLKGLRRIALASLVQVFLTPVLALAGLLLVARHAGASGAAAVYAGAALVTAAASHVLWRWVVARHRPDGSLRTAASPPVSARVLLAVALPLFLAASVRFVNTYLDVTVLGILRPADEVGIYAALSRLAGLVSFVLTAVNGAVSPRIVALWRERDLATLQRLVLDSTRLMAAVAAPLLLALVLLPGRLLPLLFGEEFRRGALPLAILAGGQFVNVATGSVGQILAMTGRQTILRNLIAASAAGNLVLDLALVPRFGMTGAAIATSLAVVATSVAATVLVARGVGVRAHAFARPRAGREGA